jgi:hypothetical protein
MGSLGEAEARIDRLASSSIHAHFIILVFVFQAFDCFFDLLTRLEEH